MNISIGIGVFLLGGWVLQSPVEEANMPSAQPSYQQAAPATQQPAANQGTGQPDTRNMGEQTYRRMLENERGTRYDPKNRQLAPSTEKDTSSTLPSSPTHTDSTGLPLPPTADPNSPQNTASQRGPAGMQMPMAPTGQHPAPSSASGMPPGPMRRPGSSSGRNPSFSGSASRNDQKAFSSYNPYSSGVSPYMNLFRNDTDAGTIDNYTSLVRPALEQRAANQRFNMDIYGLERRARIQQHSLQQMHQTERTLQGVGTPQYYMNYGGYYNSPYGQQ